MAIDVDSLRDAFGWWPAEGEEWYSADPKDLKFGEHKNDSHDRAVILQSWSTGPLATVFTRTRWTPRGGQDREWLNPAHRHQNEFRGCWIKIDGYILLTMPIQVDKDLLCSRTWMCTEPDAHTVKAVLMTRGPNGA